MNVGRNSMKICWLLENVHKTEFTKMVLAIGDSGFDSMHWNPEWDSQNDLQVLRNFNVNTLYIFWGSLNVAHRLYLMHRNIISFCAVKEFACSSFYLAAKEWILNKDWNYSTAIETVGKGPLFIRPDDALKSFSGRVLNKISLKGLDFGVYFQDQNLPVITSSVKNLPPDEWRFVVIRDKIITGSPKFYGSDVIDSFRAREFADRAVKSFCAPEMVWTVDVCKYKGDFYIIEANPFSGAQLYNSDMKIIVKEVSSIVNW